ncbi:DUF4249 domain-containing protein [Hymenobacter glaciei]|uniref:DUF4249 domain-containing protein n=1 Tax=Hymenobacter glaciei TaxID=877209 RepID=A0ABP7TUQ2_9BACT
MNSILLLTHRLRWVLLLLLPACTDPYLPEAVKNSPSYLVVDGFLNSKGVTTIKLSRTYAVGAKTAPPAETKATVYLEEEAGPRTLLREAPAGIYTSPTALTLNPAKRYRLHLNTLANQEYASNFVPVKNTPLIDDFSWRAENNGVNIRLSTHDPANATRYYRWDYVETWEINPIYRPQVEYSAGTINFPDITVPYPTKCWGTAPSTTVLLANTTPLSQDVVADRPLRQLPPSSERLNTRYSVLVQQFALTKEEFDYWELLRKNTESIGSLFDAQPAQLIGNVHCLSNSADLALGFVGAHSVTEKRLFVDRRDLPRHWPTPSGYEACYPPDTVWLSKPPLKYPQEALKSYFASGEYIPIEHITLLGIGYTGKSRDCVDCRTRGSAIKPSFWP